MAKTADTIAIYSRKSRYTGRGESIGNQIDLCREYIRTHYGDAAAEHAVVFEDEGFSGGNLNRPVFLFSVFQHFSPFSVQDSGAMPILFTKIQFHDHPAAFTVAEFLPDTPAPSGHQSSRKSPAWRNPRDLPATVPLF